jgi:DNA polymerase-3 subunit epsilon
MLDRLPELRGRILGCWCLPRQPCHAEILARLADEPLCPEHAFDNDRCIHCQLSLDAVKALVDARHRQLINRDFGSQPDPTSNPAPEPEPVHDHDTTVLIIDSETTGTDKSKDQILELAIQFGFDGADGSPAPQTVWRFKPDVPIHPGAAKIHGITAEHVASCPTFKVHAQRLFELIDAAEVLVGYNLQFDLDMIAAELARVGLPMPNMTGKTIVDALRLWHQFEPRSLTAAHERFVGVPFDGAHGASADIAATGRVLLAMCDAFGLLERGLTWAEIAEIAEPARKTWLGGSNHFVWTDGVVVMTFGKHRGAIVHEMANGLGGYLKWLTSHDFPPHVKAIAKEALSRKGGTAFLSWAAGKYPPPAEPVASADEVMP